MNASSSICLSLPFTRRARRRGAALTIVIFMLGIFGLIAGVLAVTVTADARRTRALAADAQLRQLLIAGERAAAATLDRPPTGPLHVAPPRALADDSAAIAVRFDPSPDPSDRQVNIDASVNRHRASQSLRYHRAVDRWELVAAELGR